MTRSEAGGEPANPAAGGSPPAAGPSGGSSRPPRPGLRLLLSIARVGSAVYLGLLALLFFSQGTLIFPGSASRNTPGAIVHPPPGTELVRLTTRHGDRVFALFGPALAADGRPLEPASRPTLLYFYGNGSWLEASRWEFDEFRRLGVNVMIPEYAGYGMSSGTASEAGCAATADAAHAHLLGRRDVDPRKIIAGGSSLGGAVAIDLATRKPVAGLVLFGTFTSLAELAQAEYPFVPVRLLLRHRFESESRIRRVRCPVFIAHGTNDALIPFSMSARLARAAGGPVIPLSVEGAGHNDLFEVGEPVLFQSLRQFFERIDRSAAAAPPPAGAPGSGLNDARVPHRGDRLHRRASPPGTAGTRP